MHRGAWYFHSKCKIVLIHGCVRAIVLTTIFLTGPFMSAACITALALRPFSCRVDRSFAQKTACMIPGGPAVDHWTMACFSLPTHLQSKVSFLHSTFLSTPLGSRILQPFQIRFGETKIAMQTYCISTNRIFVTHMCNFSSLEFSSIISRLSAANASFFYSFFFLTFSFCKASQEISVPINIPVATCLP